MSMLLSLLLSTIAVMIAGYLVPGVVVKDFWTALVVAIVLAVLNALVKPVLVILTLPVTIVTLGLFMIVINVLIIMIASAIVPGFIVNGFWSALLFGLVLAVLNALFASLL